jgi:hypothetical protein
MNGGEVCEWHGGRAPQVRRKAAERYAEQKAAQFVRTMKIDPVDNPLVALSMVAGEMSAIKDRLGGIVDNLEDAALRSTDDKGSEQIRGELSAYLSQLNSFAGTLGMIAKLNIDERLARITEAQKMMVIRAIEYALADAGIAGPAATRAKQVAARHLRAVPSGRAA